MCVSVCFMQMWACVYVNFTHGSETQGRVENKERCNLSHGRNQIAGILGGWSVDVSPCLLFFYFGPEALGLSGLVYKMDLRSLFLP